MSKTLERREVESEVFVYRCDRCGTEVSKSPRYGVNAPGEGVSLSCRSHREGWAPLSGTTTGDNYKDARTANVDLCDACFDGLRDWFAGGREPT